MELGCGVARRRTSSSSKRSSSKIRELVKEGVAKISEEIPVSASDADGHPSVLVSHVAVTSRAQAAQRENVVSESARRAEDGSESIAGTSAEFLPVAWRVPIWRTVKPKLGPAAPLRRTRSRSPQRCVVASPPVLVPSGCKLLRRTPKMGLRLRGLRGQEGG